MSVITFFCLLLGLINLSHSEVLKEYCSNESFNVTCPQDHVLLIKHALYGRMKKGRCIDGEGGYLGCSKKVLPIFDRKCSGLRSCVVPVHEFLSMSPCHKDFQSYLEAAYECIKLPKAPEGGCSKNRGVNIHNQDGFVMYSAKSNNRNHHQSSSSYRVPGMVDCPWNFKVKDGQKINLTLTVFGESTDNVNCNTKLQIEDGPMRHEVSLCSDVMGRVKHIYTSTHSNLSAFISRSFKTEELSDLKYLINYRAAGCASMSIDPPGWAVRHDATTLMVMCNNTGEKWFLTCTGSTWIGDIANCTKDTNPNRSNKPYSNSFYHGKLGIIFAVLIGIVLGVTIGALLLLLVHCNKRRRKEMQNNNFVMVAQDAKEKFYEEGTYKPSSVERKSGQLKDAYPALLRDTEPYESRVSTGHMQPVHKQCFSMENHNMQIKSLPHDRTLYHSLDSKCSDCACPSNANRCDVPGSRYIDVE